MENLEYHKGPNMKDVRDGTAGQRRSVTLYVYGNRDFDFNIRT